MGVHFAPAVPAPQCIGCKCPRHGAFASPDSLPRGPLPRRRCSGLLAAASDAATFSWFPHTWAEGARGMCLARILPTQTGGIPVPMKTPLNLASLKSPYRSTRCLRRCRSRRAGEPPAPDLRAVWARVRAGATCCHRAGTPSLLPSTALPPSALHSDGSPCDARVVPPMPLPRHMFTSERATEGAGAGETSGRTSGLLGTLPHLDPGSGPTDGAGRSP